MYLKVTNLVSIYFICEIVCQAIFFVYVFYSITTI